MAIASGSVAADDADAEAVARPARGGRPGSICVSSISRQTASLSSGSFAGKRAQMISICTLSGDGGAGRSGELPCDDRLVMATGGNRSAKQTSSTSARSCERVFACRLRNATARWSVREDRGRQTSRGTGDGPRRVGKRAASVNASTRLGTIAPRDR